MPLLDPADLRAYAGRDWSAPERLARQDCARLSVAERVAIGIALYEAARTTQPDWPDAAARAADLLHHRRMRSLLDRAAHVGAR